MLEIIDFMNGCNKIQNRPLYSFSNQNNTSFLHVTLELDTF